MTALVVIVFFLPSLLFFPSHLIAQHKIVLQSISKGTYTYTQTICDFSSYFPHLPIIAWSPSPPRLLTDQLFCFLWPRFLFQFHSKMFGLQKVNNGVPSFIFSNLKKTSLIPNKHFVFPWWAVCLPWSRSWVGGWELCRSAGFKADKHQQGFDKKGEGRRNSERIMWGSVEWEKTEKGGEGGESMAGGGGD